MARVRRGRVVLSGGCRARLGRLPSRRVSTSPSPPSRRNMMRTPLRSHIVTGLLGLGAIGAFAIGVGMPSPPVSAQVSVFDPANYSQNLLTAARTLSQINNQIQSLQNEAQGLVNQGKNLTRIDFPQIQELQQRLPQIDRLMGQAQGIDFRVDEIDAHYRKLFPTNFEKMLKRD